MKDEKLPKISELLRILDEEDRPIIIQPDGSLKVDRRRKGKGFISTFKKKLGDTY